MVVKTPHTPPVATSLTKIQKGFWPAISGTIEDTEFLTYLLIHARKKQRSIIATLVDKKNAFGEIHHNLIRSILKFHHLPHEVIILVEDLYTDYTTLFTINETRLDKSISNVEVNIQGYNLWRQNRCRYGGGVAIYTRDILNVREMSLFVPENIEAVCLEIIKPKTQPILITTVYRPPSSNTNFMDDLQYHLHVLDGQNKDLILTEDLNCDLSLSVLQSHSRRLMDILELQPIVLQDYPSAIMVLIGDFNQMILTVLCRFLIKKKQYNNQLEVKMCLPNSY